jgi:hypothetical protein
VTTQHHYLFGGYHMKISIRDAVTPQVSLLCKNIQHALRTSESTCISWQQQVAFVCGGNGPATAHYCPINLGAKSMIETR